MTGTRRRPVTAPVPAPVQCQCGAPTSGSGSPSLVSLARHATTVGPVKSAPVAVMVRLGEIEIEERPVPEPGPGQVLVEVSAVGVCGSDVHWFTEGRIGELVVDGPLVLGHEAAGVVRALGPGASRLSPGQRVALEPGVPCRRCRACRSGHYNLCPDIRFFATPPVDGAFARYVVHDEDFAHPLPDHVSDDAGALLEPLSVAIWATWKAGISVGDRVLVTGAGPIGLLVTAVAKAAGAVEVVVSDTQPARLAGPEDGGHVGDRCRDGKCGRPVGRPRAPRRSGPTSSSSVPAPLPRSRLGYVDFVVAQGPW